jgi:hypothetical protein
MGSHDPFGHLNTSYDQKKGRGSNCQFDSQPLKVKNRSDFLACRWHATYCWKYLDNGYNFASEFIAIEALPTKLWASKVTGIPFMGQNAIWMWPPCRNVENTIRGKVVASPKFGPQWVLWVWGCSWFFLTPKTLIEIPWFTTGVYNCFLVESDILQLFC